MMINIDKLNQDKKNNETKIEKLEYETQQRKLYVRVLDKQILQAEKMNKVIIDSKVELDINKLDGLVEVNKGDNQ